MYSYISISLYIYIDIYIYDIYIYMYMYTQYGIYIILCSSSRHFDQSFKEVDTNITQLVKQPEKRFNRDSLLVAKGITTSNKGIAIGS